MTATADPTGEFTDDFDGDDLDRDVWVPHYLPQWTTPDRSAARYELRPGVLRLRIDADQPAWRPEDGELRVSNIQTGTFAGPLGSLIGQHRHRPDLAVRTAQATRRLFTPSSGLVEAVGQERNAFIAVLRRIWDLIPYIGDIWVPFVFHFDFTDTRTGALVMSSDRQIAIRDRYTVDVPDPRLDFRVAACMAVALDALQSR